MKFTSLIQKACFTTALACLAAPDIQAQVANYRSLGKRSFVKELNISKNKKSVKAPMMFVTFNPSDYGKEAVIMEEDFSKFATGSEAKPDMNTNVILDFASGECEYPWWSLDPAYTKIPKWGGSNLFPAGGQVYMVHSNFDGEGHINTPLLDFSKYSGGIAFIQFRAKTLNENLSQRLVVEAAETNNMSPEWTVLGSELSEKLTGEWQTFTVMYYGAGATTLFNVLPQMERDWYESKSDVNAEILLDDFKVFSLDQFVNIPEGLGHSNYKGTEFDLNWNKQDADSYLVDVFTMDMNTGKRKDLVKDAKAEENTYHVTGAESGVTYFFTVTAVKGEHKSFTSLPEMVFDIEDPVFEGVPTITEVNDTMTYTSKWSAVPSAECYDYWGMHKRVAEADGKFTILSSDLNGLLDFEGKTTEWTIENKDELGGSSYGILPVYPMPQAGWVGRYYMPFKNFVCLDGWQHTVAKHDVFIVSPELDLSKDNGKLSISMKLYGEIGTYDNPIKGEVYEDVQTKAAVSLYNYDEKTGKFELAEYKAIDEVKPSWRSFEVEMTKGSKRSYIVISPIEGPEYLFIDDINITQNYKKGEALVEPFLYSMWNNIAGVGPDSDKAPSLTVKLPAVSCGKEISEKVCALKMIPGTEGEFLFSNNVSQNIGKSGIPANVENISMAEAPVTFENGHIVVNNINAAPVKVYSLDGKLVYNDSSRSSRIVLNLNKGVYLVNVGEKTVKVSF